MAAASSRALAISKSIALRILRIVSAVPIVGLLGLGLLFLLFSVTPTGRAIGLGASLLAGIFYCSAGSWRRKWFQSRRKLIFAVLLPVSLALCLFPMALRQTAEAPRTGTCETAFCTGTGRFLDFHPGTSSRRWTSSLWAAALVPLFDPYLDFSDARKEHTREIPIYKTMEEDRDFRAFGSVMGMAYRELGRMEFRTGHYFLFVPETAADERIPCLVYLHGIGGNRKPHFWAMSKVSARRKCAVIAPTFGMGNWERPGGGGVCH